MLRSRSPNLACCTKDGEQIRRLAVLVLNRETDTCRVEYYPMVYFTTPHEWNESRRVGSVLLFIKDIISSRSRNAFIVAVGVLLGQKRDGSWLAD